MSTKRKREDQGEDSDSSSSQIVIKKRARNEGKTYSWLVVESGGATQLFFSDKKLGEEFFYQLTSLDVKVMSEFLGHLLKDPEEDFPGTVPPALLLTLKRASSDPQFAVDIDWTSTSQAYGKQQDVYIIL